MHLRRRRRRTWWSIGEGRALHAAVMPLQVPPCEHLLGSPPAPPPQVLAAASSLQVPLTLPLRAAEQAWQSMVLSTPSEI